MLPPPVFVLLFGGLLSFDLFLAFISLFSELSFLFTRAQAMDFIELSLGLSFEGSNLFFSGFLVNLDLISQLLDSVIYFAGHQRWQQIDLLEAPRDVCVVSETSVFRSSLFFSLLFLLWLLGNLCVFLEFLRHYDFSTLF